MDHMVVTQRGRRVIVVDVSSSTDGAGIGYGILLKRIDRVLWYARATGTAVFYVREARAINRAVFNLESDDIEFIPRHGWEALRLRALWVAGAPFRLGSPSLWAKRTAARLFLGSFYRAVESSSWLPAPVRRFVTRPRPLYDALRRANREYAARSGGLWRQRYRLEAKRDVDAGMKPGRAIQRRLRIPAAAEREAAALAARLGIAADARIVTVHVRESGYRRAAGLRQRDWDTLRNARIGNYLDAFAALAERGYTVVRLGDSTMTPVSMPGVVDLSRLPERGEWLDVWCVQRSEFLIGCDSGPSWLAFLLGVPVLTVNALHFQDIERPRDRFIPKLVRERATGRVLRLMEMLTVEYLREGLDTSKFEHLENTPEDLRDAVLDMIEAIHRDEKLSLAQRQFKQRLVEVAHEIPHEWSGLQGIAVTGRPRGALSRPFARKYL